MSEFSLTQDEPTAMSKFSLTQEEMDAADKWIAERSQQLTLEDFAHIKANIWIHGFGMDSIAYIIKNWSKQSSDAYLSFIELICLLPNDNKRKQIVRELAKELKERIKKEKIQLERDRKETRQNTDRTILIHRDGCLEDIWFKADGNEHTVLSITQWGGCDQYCRHEVLDKYDPRVDWRYRRDNRNYITQTQLRELIEQKDIIPPEEFAPKNN